MRTIELKTNIMCGCCIAKVTPTFNEVIGANNWRVDTQNSKKVLSVTTKNLSEAAVIKVVEKAGYKAEKLA